MGGWRAGERKRWSLIDFYDVNINVSTWIVKWFGIEIKQWKCSGLFALLSLHCCTESIFELIQNRFCASKLYNNKIRRQNDEKKKCGVNTLEGLLCKWEKYIGSQVLHTGLITHSFLRSASDIHSTRYATPDVHTDWPVCDELNDALKKEHQPRLFRTSSFRCVRMSIFICSLFAHTSYIRAFYICWDIKSVNIYEHSHFRHLHCNFVHT